MQPTRCPAMLLPSKNQAEAAEGALRKACVKNITCLLKLLQRVCCVHRLCLCRRAWLHYILICPRTKAGHFWCAKVASEFITKNCRISSCLLRCARKRPHFTRTTKDASRVKRGRRRASTRSTKVLTSLVAMSTCCCLHARMLRNDLPPALLASVICAS